MTIIATRPYLTAAVVSGQEGCGVHTEWETTGLYWPPVFEGRTHIRNLITTRLLNV